MTKLSERLELNRSMKAPKVAQLTGRNIAEFEELFEFLASRNGWEKADYVVWYGDLTVDIKLTIGCLRALKNSWDDSRYGYLTEQDWGDACAIRL